MAWNLAECGMHERGAPELPYHARENRTHWDGHSGQWVAAGERAWAAAEPYWGVWAISEHELRMLPSDMSQHDAIELGCGTGYVSAWMARRGARVVGIDNSERQLETARRLAEEHGIPLTLVHGNAETVPYPNESFDFAVSEHGAATWCDPYLWIPEAHRLLKPGGELVLLSATPLTIVCAPPSGAGCETRLHRDYFGLHKVDWTKVEVDPGGVEFSLPISAWFRLFRTTGFQVLDYIEIQAPESAPEYAFGFSRDWARRWPSEHVWKVRKTH
jgi:SAM-dependent methyltransferase